MSKSIQAYVAELLGTMFLVLIGCGSIVLTGGTIGMLGIALTFGLTLLVLAYIFGPISGCHLNPAVTLGLTISGKFDITHTIQYIIAQLIGAFLGAYILHHIAMGVAGFDMAQGFATNQFPHEGAKFMTVAITEMLLIGVLVLAVLSTTDKGFPAGFGPITVGMTLLVIHIIAIPASGASLNFARSFGPALIAKGQAIDCLAYLAAFNVGGAIVGFILHKLVHLGK